MTVSAEIAYLFRHALLREAAYQLQTPAVRGVLHGLALEIMEELAQSGPEHRLDAWAAELAEHAGQACDAEGADRATLQSKELEYLERAAQHEQGHWHNRQAAELFQAVSRHPLADKHQRIESLLSAARTLGITGGLTQAMDLQRQALEMAEDCGDDRLQARALLSGARIANSQSRYDESDELCRKAQRAAEHAKAPELQADCLIESARTASARGDFRKTEKRATQAWELLKDAGSPTKRARSEIYIADSLWQQGRIEEAVEHYDAVLQVYEQAGELGGLAMASDHRGSLASAQGHHEQALEYHRRAADIYARIGDVLGRAAAISNIGNIYQFLGRIKDARTSYLAALKQIRNVGQRYLEGVALGNLGSVNRKLGRLEESSECLQRARDALRESGRVIEYAVFDAMFGSLLLLLGFTDAGEVNARQSARTLDEVGATSWREQFPGVLQIRILVHRKLHGVEQAGRDAEDRLREMLKLQKKTGRVTDSGLNEAVEKCARLIEESLKGRPLIFRGYLVDELQAPLRVALLDRMQKMEPEDWKELQTHPVLLAAMRADTEGLPIPDWESVDPEAV